MYIDLGYIVYLLIYSYYCYETHDIPSLVIRIKPTCCYSVNVHVINIHFDLTSCTRILKEKYVLCIIINIGYSCISLKHRKGLDYTDVNYCQHLYFVKH